VVQLLPVDEPAGGLVAYLGVVLPAVPEPGGHLGDLAGLPPQRVGGCGMPAPEEAGLALGRRHVELPAGPAAADPVEGRHRRLDVEGLGVGGGHGRHQTDPAGGGRETGEHGERVGPGAREGVAERHEVEPATLRELRRLDVRGGVEGRLLIEGGGQVQQPPAVRCGHIG
jgi:hypothetical protein